MKPLHDLRAEQANAATPADNAWVSASAGTGKTQVLSARVLRLLLGGAAPDRILCLTFTKAGAAEMQARVFDRLAHWVRASDDELRSDLDAIRADSGPEALAHARTLFAHTLDSRGGLRVQTLHAYAQSLLAAFPVEAGIAPGFEALADRDAQALRGRILTESIEAAAAEHDTRFLDDVGAISIARGEGALDKLATVLIGYTGPIADMGDPRSFEVRLRRAFGLPGEGTRDEVLAAAIARLDHEGLRELAEHLLTGPSTFAVRGDNLLCWLGYAPPAQTAQLTMLCHVFHKKTVDERMVALVHGGKKADAFMVELADELCLSIDALVELRRMLDAVDNAARHLRVGARLCAAYNAHKRRAGVIDYNDMIALAAELLARPGMGEWVRYKLDARIDHLLVDEAQDTNPSQWRIVGALTDEFFDGQGARDVQRTLFVVGDFKQAIFSFQGSDPKLFDEQQQAFRQKVGDALLGWRDVDLAESFRSVPAVLEVVDTVVGQLGFAALGLAKAPPSHVPARTALPGAVTLWPPLTGEGDPEEDERAWLPSGQIQMAHQLARQIAAWLKPETALRLPARDRNVRPEDILVLVRNRGEFVQPLVAALHQFGVPVAGADRLRLTEPLAVQDCLALIRFVLQPGDDLTCATLLTSPFIGLDHDALFELAHNRKGSLSAQVQAAGGPAHEWLAAVLGLADFSAPYEFLATILSGDLGGGAKLLARLGEEAREAVQAVLAQALAFEVANAPTLQGFLAWMEGQATDIKRDPDAPLDAVRIMTVHGAKGLQAPVVILADAARGEGRPDDHVLIDFGHGPVPVFHGGASGRVGPIAEAADYAEARALEEHWRLLYVALTRAEDLLFVGGALPRPRGDKPVEVPENSWHGAVEAALADLDAVAEPVDIWGSALVYRSHEDGDAQPDAKPDAAPAPPEPPAWARTMAPAEAQPPRPLSPSAIAADDIASPPPTPAMQRAARRGSLLHALFERLPQVAVAEREAVAERWLGTHAPEFDAGERAALAATALGIVGDSRFAALFGPDALAEAPIAAVIEGVVVAGTVDRLLVEAGRVQLVDFKTGSRVPSGPDTVEPYHLKQMAAYVAALQVVFPGRRIEAGLLYTHDATLIELPAALLETHRPRLGPRLGAPKETLGVAPR
ncbi:double-strand break repair helicase AddA [Sphingosinicellaceae bacterium]|nr:double-strand break repair helicase AddA [Sphingosinicellaceae bacterium]